MVGFFETITRDLSGAGRFRLILQPVMAIALGIRLGRADARQGQAPFVMRLLTERERRLRLFRDSLRDAVIPLAAALILDAIFQLITLRFVRPLAAVLVGAVLVWLPFVLSRAATNRIVTRPRTPRRRTRTA